VKATDHDDDPEQMLTDTIAKARKLVAELERQQKEIEAAPPDLPPEQFAEGKQAFDNAVAAARRMLKSLEDAAALPAD
jgi:NifB/MoaA-like Fe-S oxidoreductase